MKKIPSQYIHSHIDEYVIKKHYIITNMYTKITKISMYKTYIHTCYVYTPLIKDHVITVKASYRALSNYVTSATPFVRRMDRWHIRWRLDLALQAWKGNVSWMLRAFPVRIPFKKKTAPTKFGNMSFLQKRNWLDCKDCSLRASLSKEWFPHAMSASFLQLLVLYKGTTYQKKSSCWVCHGDLNKCQKS